MLGSAANEQPPNPVVGIQWHNKHQGTCGRIGALWKMWHKLGGYDESMLAMGRQDVCLARCTGLIGPLDKRTGDHGFTVSNRPDQFKKFLGDSVNAKRKANWKGNTEKLKWLPDYEKSLGSFAAICKHSGKIMKARLQKQSGSATLEKELE